MNTYIKTWLQLAFPAYVFLLVILVIIISSYSIKFSNLIGKKNPVATLAILILLSCAKLLEVCLIQVYQLEFLSILMAQAKRCGSLMQLSNISQEHTFISSLQLFSFSWLVWSTLLFSSRGNAFSIFQGGESSSGQGIQRYRLLSKHITNPILPTIATGPDYC